MSEILAAVSYTEIDKAYSEECFRAAIGNSSIINSYLISIKLQSTDGPVDSIFYFPSI